MGTGGLVGPGQPDSEPREKASPFSEMQDQGLDTKFPRKKPSTKSHEEKVSDQVRKNKSLSLYS